MNTLHVADYPQVKQWLSAAGIKHYLCDHCQGLHLTDLNQQDGVLESRLFVQEEGLLLTTEMELRPSMLMAINAELSAMNMAHPALKCFIDMLDDTLPQLVCCGFLPRQAGLSAEQVVQFVTLIQHATEQVLAVMHEQQWIYEDMDSKDPISDALH